MEFRSNIVVLVPLPLQGHITPMLQLGTVLHSKGFSIVVAHSEFRPPNPSNHPEFIFHQLSDNLAHHDASLPNLLNLILAIHKNCRNLLEDYLVELTEHLGCRVSCIIYDSCMFFVDSVATRLNIPSIILRPNTVTYMKTYQSIFQLHKQNRIPVPESSLDDLMPQFHPLPLRLRDLPFPVSMGVVPQDIMDFFVGCNSKHSSVALVVNTVDYLEHSALSALRQQWKIPILPVGPLHKMAAAKSTSFLEEDRSFIAWIDKQASSSVLYISSGSIANMNQQELTETAWGLANSGQPFLWVISVDAMNGSKWDLEQFPEALKTAVAEERGVIVNWAPQKEVLAHRAVGGFWSHCGWNSTLESISEGVPIICGPKFGDQHVNARLLTCVWKVGLEIEDVLDRESIERTIRRVMASKEGKELRHRTLEMKKMLEAAREKGGTSYESLNGLTELIASF